MAIWNRLRERYKDVDLDRPAEDRPTLEKGDLPAMLAAAFLNLFLPTALILVGFVLLVMFLFGML